MTIELTVLMPCLNEAETIERCIIKALDFFKRTGIKGEVLIADNGSTDGSQKMALDLGARVEPVPQRGYGAALIGGIAAAKGQYIIMGDADDSYDFSKLDGMVEELRKGADLVMGDRFKGGIADGAMPFLHKYLGNPVLSFLGRLFFNSPIRDFHCGLRGFNRQSMLNLKLETTGMEFASEMVVKSALHGIKIAQVPVTLAKDGRSRPPHLRTWRDGWRHLKFLLMFSPRWLFLIPGMALLITGLLAMAIIAINPIVLGHIGLDIHTMTYAGGGAVIGFQMILFAFFTKALGVYGGWFPENHQAEKFTKIPVEYFILNSIVLFLVGLAMSLYAVWTWKIAGYGALNPQITMRLVVPSVTIMTLAGELFLAGFFVESIKLLGKRNK